VSETASIQTEQQSELLRIDELLAQVDRTPGWLTVPEASALLGATLAALTQSPGPHHIVEIGSFSGRSTIVLGSAVRAISPESTVHAIDPHEGCESGGPDTAERFQRNIAEAGLDGQVNMIRARSTEVLWELPISLLFIDGLHDLVNVACDLFHFEAYVPDGGLVAFHDYDPGWPAVMRFVDRLLGTGTYELVDQGGSLIVLRKVRNLLGAPLMPALEAMRGVEGWFSDREGVQLAISLAEVLSRLEPASVVEIGPVRGRATAVSGSIARHFGATVFSIDRFDGRVGAEPAFWEVGYTRAEFEATLTELGLTDTVTVIQGAPPDVPWDRPVDFLLVDGWRDHANVQADFAHFEPWIRDGGLVAFHDFDPSWAGVQLVVWELLDRPDFAEAGRSDSLIVLRKQTA
jgi:predicted O-methyltransferase YrrM